MSTTNLEIGTVASNQTQKEVPINDGFQKLDDVITQFTSVTITNTNAATISKATMQTAAVLVLNAGSPAPTGPITITMTALERGMFAVLNLTAQAATITIAGQSVTAPVVLAGQMNMLTMDGVDVRVIQSSAGPFTNLTDVPSSYSGAGGYFLKVNSGATGIEFVAASGITTFLELTDTFSSYAGLGGYKLKVNSAATAVEAVKEYMYAAGSFGGSPTASQRIFHHVAGLAFTFPASLTGSLAKAKVAATAQTDFDIRVATSSVGTMRFAASATSATFIFSSPIAVTAGDEIEIIAPATPDATLADITWNIRGDV